MNEWIVVKSHPEARWYDAHALLSDIPANQYCFFFYVVRRQTENLQEPYKDKYPCLLRI
jgi:hypothetical protein